MPHERAELALDQEKTVSTMKANFKRKPVLGLDPGVREFWTAYSIIENDFKLRHEEYTKQVKFDRPPTDYPIIEQFLTKPANDRPVFFLPGLHREIVASF